MGKLYENMFPYPSSSPSLPLPVSLSPSFSPSLPLAHYFLLLFLQIM